MHSFLIRLRAVDFSACSATLSVTNVTCLSAESTLQPLHDRLQFTKKGSYIRIITENRGITFYISCFSPSLRHVYFIQAQEPRYHVQWSWILPQLLDPCFRRDSCFSVQSGPNTKNPWSWVVQAPAFCFLPRRCTTEVPAVVVGSSRTEARGERGSPTVLNHGVELSSGMPRS